jgi:antitoxin ParD1/3/4
MENIFMATTSLSLGKHWEYFIQENIQSGRYGSASEIVRDSLRLLEEREIHLESLRSKLISGENSGSIGTLNMESVKEKAKIKAG